MNTPYSVKTAVFGEKFKNYGSRLIRTFFCFVAGLVSLRQELDQLYTFVHGDAPLGSHKGTELYLTAIFTAMLTVQQFIMDTICSIPIHTRSYSV